MRPEADSIDTIAGALVKLDFIQAKAKLAHAMKATEPKLTDDQSLVFLQARHPLINPETVIANDICLGEDYDTMLITGKYWWKDDYIKNSGYFTVNGTIRPVYSCCRRKQSRCF